VRKAASIGIKPFVDLVLRLYKISLTKAYFQTYYSMLNPVFAFLLIHDRPDLCAGMGGLVAHEKEATSRMLGPSAGQDEWKACYGRHPSPGISINLFRDKL
jgi:hypothetical protein